MNNREVNPVFNQKQAKYLLIGVVLVFLFPLSAGTIPQGDYGTFLIVCIALGISVWAAMKSLPADENKSVTTTRYSDMDSQEFEQEVADIWNSRGWETELTPPGADKGVDVIAKKEDPHSQKVVIQAKKYSKNNKVGSPEIQQYASLKDQENADQVIIATSSDFTEQAKSIAKDLNVKLINGRELEEMKYYEKEDSDKAEE